MEMVITKGTKMMQKIEPWFEKENRYTNPRLRPDTPQEIVELYEKYKEWREEYQRTSSKFGFY
ncbi:hypothetical protein [Streptococcus ovis]|uniref:hypothetical protein n=1 Tax=Streptococcus ovis TaxID=82806 RepID=UPI0003655C45|nr:hypothetical protein [Streptococcus ovis]